MRLMRCRREGCLGVVGTAPDATCTNCARPLVAPRHPTVEELAETRRRSPSLPSSSRQLSASQVLDIRRRREAGEPLRSIAECFGLTYGSIYHLVTGRTYRDVA